MDKQTSSIQQPTEVATQKANTTETKSSPKFMKFVLVFQTLLLLTLVGGFAFLAYTIYSEDKDTKVEQEEEQEDANKEQEDEEEDDQNTDEQSNTQDSSSSSSSTTTSPEDSSSSDVPAGWVAVENSKQNYTAYRPTSWYYRYFGNNFETLGLDPNPIPEVSEHAGTITINYLEGKTVAVAVNDLESMLEAGYEEKTENHNGHAWTIVKGTTDPDRPFVGGKKVKAGYVSITGKTFEVKLEVDPADFSANESILDTVIDTLDFHM